MRARDTSCSADCVRCRSRLSPRSTAPASAAESSWRCTARREPSRPGCATLRFPEVFLGLFPAWGGTQLLPRLVGPETAIKVIVSNPLRQNRMLTGPQVAELGIADRLLEPAEFVDESLAFARELADRPLERPEPDWSDAETIFRRARTAVDDTVHGAAPAPYAALDLIAGAQEWTIEEGYRSRAGSDRRAPSRPAGAGVALRVPARRAAREEAPGSSHRAAAEGQQGRHRRRRPDGAADRDAVPAPAGGADRAPRREAGDRRRGACRHPRGDRRPGRQGPLRRGQGTFPLLPRVGQHGLRRLRRLRPRARGGVRGARGEEAGVRRARADRARRVRARDEYLGPVDHGHGRRPAPARTRRGHALLQSGRADAAARGRAGRRDRRRGARDRLGRRREARQAADPRQRRAGLRRQPRAHAHDARDHGRRRARHSRSRRWTRR